MDWFHLVCESVAFILLFVFESMDWIHLVMCDSVDWIHTVCESVDLINLFVFGVWTGFILFVKV